MLAQRMVGAATAWLSSLEPGSGPRGLRVLGARGARPLALHPTEQGGLPRAEMGPLQQRHAHRLLARQWAQPARLRRGGDSRILLPRPFRWWSDCIRGLASA
jgi:hypothetical protein